MTSNNSGGSFLSRILSSTDAFTARKTVTFGDASAVVGSTFWSLFAVFFLLTMWWASSYFEWTDPIFLPGPGSTYVEFLKVSCLYEKVPDAFLIGPSEEWNKLFAKGECTGYRNITLGEHLTASFIRIVWGFSLGTLVGVPLGLAMGLSNFLRGLLDPIVEFFRPIPPLAFIPLVILWFGIGEESKVLLLFLAALWIMAIAARSGVLGVKLSKVHAAYSLGASKFQILRHVILPNALPDIFVGMRVSLGVCWGTLVAAEFVGAQEGIGIMLWIAQKFFITEIVIIGIVIIGIIAVAMDLMMRWLEGVLIPWRGKG